MCPRNLGTIEIKVVLINALETHRTTLCALLLLP